MNRFQYKLNNLKRTLEKRGIFFTIWKYTKGLVKKGPIRLFGDMERWIIGKTTKVRKDRVIFTTFQGDYTCNPKYISEALHELCPELKIIWAVRRTTMEDHADIPDYVSLVRRRSFRFYKAWAEAKAMVVNSVDVFGIYMPKKPEQFLVQTWHGSLGIKRFGKDPFWTLLGAAKRMAKVTDAIISNSEFEDFVYRDTFWANVPILRYGHARNDILISTPENQQKAAQIGRRLREQYEIGEEVRLILYAPTFRNALNVDCYAVDCKGVVKALEKRFGGEWKLLMRLHPTARKKQGELALDEEYAIDVTAYPDMQDLIVISDAMITDYSSGIFDFIVSRKPGFIFATDIEEYNNERGFYYKLEDTPFPIATNNEELLANIQAFDLPAYKTAVEAFLEGKGCVDDGQAAKRTARLIADVVQGRASLPLTAGDIKEHEATAIR